MLGIAPAAAREKPGLQLRGEPLCFSRQDGSKRGGTWGLRGAELSPSHDLGKGERPPWGLQGPDSGSQGYIIHHPLGAWDNLGQSSGM